MAAGKDTALRLILVTDLVNEAEALVSRLRNAGTAVRPLRPESLDELTDMLARQPVDMVLADYGATLLPFEQVAKAVLGCGRDVPLLAVLDGVDDDALERALTLGAQTVALRERAAQFLKVVHAEWQALESRRSQRRLEAQMRETQRRCDMLIDSSREPIAYIHEGMHIRANQAYLDMFGFETFEDIEGMSLLDLVAPADVAALKDLLKHLAKGEDAPSRHELTARDAEGHSFPAVMEFTPAEYQGEPCLQLIFRRQTVEVDPELARQLEDLKQRDPATGLLNRPTFLGLLDAAVAEAATGGAGHGLLLVEPDHYVQLLNVIGLDAADELLAALGQRLTETAPQAQIGRFGEHQLAILIPNSDYYATKALADALRAAVADAVLVVGSNSLNATISIGGVQIGEKIASTSQVLAKANQSLAAVVSSGGNRADVFDPGAQDRAEQERIAAWLGRIRGALDGQGFQLGFQPVVSLHGETEEAYEMRLHLLGSDGVPVPADTFLPIAEEHGLLGEIDRWAVARAIALIGERRRIGKSTRLLLSVSQDAVLDPAMPEFIGQALASAGVPGQLLSLAVAETKVFVNLNATQSFIDALAPLGVTLALERFGAGLNSLQILQHVTPALLKIDPQFMDDLPKNTTAQDKLREIAQKAHDLGIRTMAPNVQDAASMTLLFSTGIHYVQGDFLAPAGPDMNYDFSL
jgi:diguanylate cyclase (GGDEF)-like protein/PAS domain S-box-containing protein